MATFNVQYSVYVNGVSAQVASREALCTVFSCPRALGGIWDTEFQVYFKITVNGVIVE